MNLQPIRIEEKSSIRCELQLETTGPNRYCYTLIAKFIGEYRMGSSGAPDARFIGGMSALAVAMWRPAGFILDLSELRYEWGDEMLNLLPPETGCAKEAVVVGPHCARAIATMMWGIETTRQATEADFIFDNLESAWELVRYREI